MIGGEAMAVGYNGGRRYHNVLPFLPSPILLDVIFVIIALKGGNLKNVFVSPLRSLLYLDGVCLCQSLRNHK